MDTLFFIASKLLWALVRPETWIALWVVWIIWRPGRRKAVGLLAFICLLAIPPSADFVIGPLEHKYAGAQLPDQVDGFIVLGGGENGLLSDHWKQPVLGDGAERLTATLALSIQYPDARILVTGGSGSINTQNLRGGRFMKDFLVASGVDPSRIIVEDQSRNTWENAILSKPLANPKVGETWVLVTSAFHMPRSMAVFKAADWQVTPWPVDFRTGAFRKRIGWKLAINLHQVNVGAKEWLGILVYWATGRAAWPF